MPTALIADDEDALRVQLLSALRSAWPELQVLQECINGVDAWDAFLEHEPQVCFLDVRMPGLTGIEVAQRIGARAHIVFIAAPNDHVLSAFAAGAVDCVLKPIDAEHLAAVVAAVKARLAGPSGAPADLQVLLNRLVGQVRKPAPLEVLQAGAGIDARVVRIDDVLYFETEGRYTRVLYTDDDGDGELLIRRPLKELLAELDPARFWQIHRGVIVNRRHVAGVQRLADGSMIVRLHGRSQQLPVARHFQPLFDSQ